MGKKKLEFVKMLDKEMNGLIGKENWNVWKKEIEPEMYSTIIQVMNEYGNKK